MLANVEYDLAWASHATSRLPLPGIFAKCNSVTTTWKKGNQYGKASFIHKLSWQSRNPPDQGRSIIRYPGQSFTEVKDHTPSGQVQMPGEHRSQYTHTWDQKKKKKNHRKSLELCKITVFGQVEVKCHSPRSREVIHHSPHQALESWEESLVYNYTHRHSKIILQSFQLVRHNTSRPEYRINLAKQCTQPPLRTKRPDLPLR